MLTGSPSKRTSPESIGWMPATHLISVDLPAPLSPTSAMTSPGVDVEVDLVQHLHGAEALADAAQLEERRSVTLCNLLLRVFPWTARAPPSGAPFAAVLA